MEIIKVSNFKLTAVALLIWQISFASSSLAARYDLIEQQAGAFESPEGLGEDAQSNWDMAPPVDFIDQEKENKRAKYLSVVNFIKQKQFEQAGNKITALFNETPDDPYLYNLQALLDIMTGKMEAAKQNYQKAIRLAPNNSPAYFGLAKLAIADERLGEAKDYADKLLAINEKNAAAYLLKAEIANKQGDKQKTEQILLKGHQKVVGDVIAEAQLVTALGKFYARHKQADKILPLSQDLVKRYPNNSQVLFIQAGAQIVNDQKPLAEQTLQKIIRQEGKKDTKHRILLASLLAEHPDREKDVHALLDEVFEINPAKPQALVLKAAYFVKKKHYQQALDTANKVETLFPSLEIGKQLAGEIYLADKKFDQALGAFQQAYQIKPNIKVLMVMADLMTMQRKQPDAIKLLKRELGKNINNIAINFKLANIFQLQDDYEQAEKHYKAILAEQPENALVLNNLAWIYAQQKNPEAVIMAKKAYDKAPKSAAIADTYGYILIHRQGELEKGRVILQEAVRIAPQAHDIQFHLAEAYSLSGEKLKAITILEALDKVTKPFSEKDKVKQLLMKLKAE